MTQACSVCGGSSFPPLLFFRRWRRRRQRTNDNENFGQLGESASFPSLGQTTAGYRNKKKTKLCVSDVLLFCCCCLPTCFVRFLRVRKIPSSVIIRQSRRHRLCGRTSACVAWWNEKLTQLERFYERKLLPPRLADCLPTGKIEFREEPSPGK